MKQVRHAEATILLSFLISAHQEGKHQTLQTCNMIVAHTQQSQACSTIYSSIFQKLY